MLKKIYITIIISLFIQIVNSQNPVKIDGKVSSDAFVSNGSIAPFWLTARQEGRWSLYNKNQFLTTAGATLNKNINKWSFFADVEFDYNTGFDKVYLHHGYLKTNWNFLSLTIGRHTFSPIFEKDKYVGTGSYLFGDNSRPMDRITAGIPEYTKIPFTKGVIEIRGGLSHGRFDDSNGNHILSTGVNYYHSEILLHEKYAYIRFNIGKWKPYAGLNHSIFMGGYDGSGKKIPIDYWKAFLGKGSEKIGGGDATNAAGAHMALYDFGLYKIFPLGKLQFYFQSPFGDGSGMKIFHKEHDRIIGINLNTNIRRIRNITVEWVKTTEQSGKGLPDPIVNGTVYPVSVIKKMGLDEFMNNIVGVEGNGFTLDNVIKYLEDNFNNGYPFGGRDGYMSNGTYPGGWTFRGMIMGSPLNLTRDQLFHLNPNLGSYKSNYIVNDRFKAFHIGAAGDLINNLKWEAMFTFSKNYGSYFNEYPGRYTWDRTENYFFDAGLKQFYSSLGILWQPWKKYSLFFKGKMAWDSGELFDSFGGKFGVEWIF